MSVYSFLRLTIASPADYCEQVVSGHRPAWLRWLIARCCGANRYCARPVMRLALLASLVLTCQGACAQSEPVPATNDRLAAATPGARDTIVAIQQVFRSRRRGGAILLAGSAAFVSVVAVSTTLEAKSLFGPGAVALLSIMGTSPVWIVGIVKQVRFSAQRERRTLADYQQRHTIPPFIRRRMRLAK